MDIRQLSPTVFVAPQLDPADLPDIAAAGITLVICNRPDAEVPPSHQAAAIRSAAEAAGLAFEELPLTHQSMTPDNIARQRTLIEAAEGPVLAYCASGTRCSVVWSLAYAGTLGPDAVLEATRAAGYALDNLRPTLEAAAEHGL